MKWNMLILSVIVLLVVMQDTRGQAMRRSPSPQRQQNTSAVVGVRRHSEHREFEQLPFSDRDMSYVLAWEIHDQVGYWQLGLNYTPNVGDATNDVRYVATPFVNLMLKDRGWLAGVGALSSYVAYGEEREWTRLYWQLMLGFSIPVSRFEIDILAYYPFDRWGNLRDFSTRNIEFGGLFRYRF